MPTLPTLPVGATDSHMHIFDHSHEWASTAVLFPDEHLLPAYREVQAQLGTSRNVFVQPSSYGTDNDLLVEVLSQMGPTARGIAVVTPQVAAEELELLDRSGVRGVRFNLAQYGATSFDMVRPLAKRVAELGWHIQVHAPANDLLSAAGLWSDLPCPLVFDHLARVPLPEGTASPVFTMVRDLLRAGKAWVKLSAPYIDSLAGPPYPDSMAVARGFIQANPERVVWGSDWPHVTEKDKPDDGLLLAAFIETIPDEVTLEQVFVTNPTELYGY